MKPTTQNPINKNLCIQIEKKDFDDIGSVNPKRTPTPAPTPNRNNK